MEVVPQVNPHSILDSSRQLLPMLEQSLILFKDDRSGHGKTATIGSHLFDR